MKRVWILSTAYLLVACAAMICHGVTGHQNDSMPAELVSRIEYFEVGKDANLTCDSRTWSGALYYIWKINISGVHCLISESKKNPPHNNCTGGKMLRNSTKGTSYLSIPLFGPKDEGTYKCEVAYIGGADTTIITVLAAVPPVLSTRLEQHDGQWFAVCSAAGGKPAPNLSWKETWGYTERPKHQTPNGSLTVERWLLLPASNVTENLTCVSSQTSWNYSKNITLKIPDKPIGWLEKENSPDRIIPLVTGCTILVIVALAFVFSYAARKHLSKFSSLIGPCCNSDVPSSTESKPSQEVEEVEPYESYVQRVNSIYNSSADLFGV